MDAISLSFAITHVGSDLDHETGMPCPACRRTLTLHQPDPQSPDRMLATCDACDAWFLLHAAAGLMIRLPAEADLLGASSAISARGTSCPALSTAKER